MKKKREMPTEKIFDLEMTLIFKVTVTVMMVFTGGSYSPYVVFDLKLLEASLANVARCHGCGSKISLEQYLDQRQSIGAYLKLY